MAYFEGLSFLFPLGPRIAIGTKKTFTLSGFSVSFTHNASVNTIC